MYTESGEGATEYAKSRKIAPELHNTESEGKQWEYQNKDMRWIIYPTKTRTKQLCSLAR